MMLIERDQKLEKLRGDFLRGKVKPEEYVKRALKLRDRQRADHGRDFLDRFSRFGKHV